MTISSSNNKRTPPSRTFISRAKHAFFNSIQSRFALEGSELDVTEPFMNDPFSPKDDRENTEPDRPNSTHNEISREDLEAYSQEMSLLPAGFALGEHLHQRMSQKKS